MVTGVLSRLLTAEAPAYGPQCLLARRTAPIRRRPSSCHGGSLSSGSSQHTRPLTPMSGYRGCKSGKCPVSTCLRTDRLDVRTGHSVTQEVCKIIPLGQVGVVTWLRRSFWPRQRFRHGVRRRQLPDGWTPAAGYRCSPNESARFPRLSRAVGRSGRLYARRRSGAALPAAGG